MSEELKMRYNPFSRQYERDERMKDEENFNKCQLRSMTTNTARNEYLAEASHVYNFKDRYYYEDLYFHSEDEICVWIYCVDKAIPVVHCPEMIDIFDNNKIVSTYIIPFKINGEFISINSDMTRSFNDDFFEKYNIRLLSEEDMKSIREYVHDIYTSDYTGLFRCDLPFPYPNDDFHDQSDYGIIMHFHNRSIYNARVCGQITAPEAWPDKILMKKMAINRLRYVGECTPLRIVRGYTITKDVPRVSVFQPKKARDIIEKYLSDAKNIYDPFSGFSARMIASIENGIPYIGRDLNQNHIVESMMIARCIALTTDINVSSMVNLGVGNALTTAGEYDCVFTCSPYGMTESWNGNNDVDLSCDDWIDVILRNIKARKYVFVTDARILKYRPYAVEAIRNKSHYNTNYELIVVIERKNTGYNIIDYGDSKYVVNNMLGADPFTYKENVFDLRKDKNKDEPVKYVFVGNGVTPFDY